MAIETKTEQKALLDEGAVWEPPNPPTNLIFDDGEPLETNRHRIAMNVLIRSLKQGWTERQDVFVGGNMFVYYSAQQARNRDFKGPDFFVVLGVDSNPERQGWVVWEEGGRYPDMIVELLSPSTAEVDRGTKKNLYEQVFRTRDYFVFDPFAANSLEGWHLDLDWGYQALVPNEQGRLWCKSLGLWLGTWQGVVEDDTTQWLRFYDAAENLVLLPEEAERQRAEQERQRAERLAARLQDLGEDPDSL
ncbi:Uma2 family endonuclease [Chroococcidiopsis sp. CCMEE 29]|uniref:Uma2 family endonuclease n=1 Tax=Chroococcidiopsis sp. CCMEE 29 TaxID=155894 RepID=UPI0020202A06|nr:Uma2 family endonuclease [Chroococcidiopsis sp. CCMEE 29]